MVRPIMLAIWLFASPIFAQAQKTPIPADAYFQRGLTAHQQRDLKSAIEYYSLTLDRDAEHWNALFNRGIAFFDKKQFQKCAADLDRYLDAQPTDRAALERRGEAAFNLQKNGEAISFFNRAIQVADSPRLRTSRGIAHLENGNVEKALEDFREAIRLDETYLEAKIGLSQAFLALKEYGKAEKLILEAIGSGDSDFRLDFNLGIAYAAQKRFSEAVEQFDRVLAKGGSAEALAKRAMCFFKMNDFAKAAEDARRANNMDVKNADAYHVLALLEFRQERFDIAENIFSEAIQWQPRNATLLTGRGHARLKKGKFDLALEDLNEAIGFEPKSGEAFYIRASTRIMLNDRKNACLDYQKAVEIGYEPFTLEEGTVFCEMENGSLTPKTEE